MDSGDVRCALFTGQFGSGLLAQPPQRFPWLPSKVKGGSFISVAPSRSIGLHWTALETRRTAAPKFEMPARRFASTRVEVMVAAVGGPWETTATPSPNLPSLCGSVARTIVASIAASE